MAGFRQPEIPRDQLVLWEQRLDDALPVDHPVRQLDDLLRSDAFSETFKAWEREYVLAEGKPPFHPRDLAALYVYGMLNKIRSSRQSDVYRCPMGAALRFVGTGQLKMKWGTAIRRQYRGDPACAGCPRALMCCENPETGRTVNRDQYEDHRERMRARMSSGRGRSRYRLRRQTVEPRFGQIKRNLGLRRFLRRGLCGVQAEWTLACIAVNLGILLRSWQEVRAVL